MVAAGTQRGGRELAASFAQSCERGKPIFFVLCWTNSEVGLQGCHLQYLAPGVPAQQRQPFPTAAAGSRTHSALQRF